MITRIRRKTLRWWTGVSFSKLILPSRYRPSSEKTTIQMAR